jgi:hypothetical protein
MLSNNLLTTASHSRGARRVCWIAGEVMASLGAVEAQPVGCDKSNSHHNLGEAGTRLARIATHTLVEAARRLVYAVRLPGWGSRAWSINPA